jgi:hypothetical protein
MVRREDKGALRGKELWEKWGKEEVGVKVLRDRGILNNINFAERESL